MYGIPVPVSQPSNGVGGSNTTINNNNNSSISNGNSKRRLAAERAAIRQKVRDDIAKQQNAIKRQREFSEKTRLWNEEIIPYWDDIGKSQRVRDLCTKGIPPNIRGKVWPIVVGNALEVFYFLFFPFLFLPFLFRLLC